MASTPRLACCRLLQRPASLSGAAAQAGLAAGRADAALPIMEGMPAGLRRIASQAAQLLTSHVRSSSLAILIVALCDVVQSCNVYNSHGGTPRHTWTLESQRLCVSQPNQ